MSTSLWLQLKRTLLTFSNFSDNSNESATGDETTLRGFETLLTAWLVAVGRCTMRPLPEPDDASPAIRGCDNVFAVGTQSDFGEFSFFFVLLENGSNGMRKFTERSNKVDALVVITELLNYLAIEMSQMFTTPVMSAETMKRPVASVAKAKISLSLVIRKQIKNVSECARKSVSGIPINLHDLQSFELCLHRNSKFGMPEPMLMRTPSTMDQSSN